MTYATFLAALRKTPRKWRISFSGAIRIPGGLAQQCPLSSLVGKGVGYYDEGAKLAGVTKMDNRIVRAADNCAGHSKRIRRDLLKACGLKERKR